jgi:hypothetical protein
MKGIKPAIARLEVRLWFVSVKNGRMTYAIVR